MVPPGGLFGSLPCRDDNSGSSDNGSRTATGQDSRSGKHDNKNLPPHRYGYPPSHQPFPGAPQFCHNSPFKMTKQFTTNHQRKPTISKLWAQWQGYDLHQGSYGKCQMFSHQQIPGQEPSCPGAPRVPPWPPGNNPVNWPISSSSTPPPRHPFGAPVRPPISLPMNGFLPPAEPRKTDVARIADLPPLPEIFNQEYDADNETDNSSDLGGAEGKPLVSLK